MIKILKKIENELKTKTGINVCYSSEKISSGAPSIAIDFRCLNLDPLDIVDGKKKKLALALLFTSHGSGLFLVNETIVLNDKILDTLADFEDYEVITDGVTFSCEINKKSIITSGSFDETGTNYRSEFEFEIEYVKND